MIDRPSDQEQEYFIRKDLERLKAMRDEHMKKQQDAERYKKIIRVYKGLKPDQAGQLIDKLEEDLAIELLNQMDQKTVAKLIPYLNQPRVLRWTRQNLKDH